MSDRYKGAILSPTAPTVTPQSAGGIYTSSQQLQYQGQGVWPTAANNPLINSLRFRSSASAYLNRTPASAGNRQKWTWSGWIKRGELSPGVNFKSLFGAGISGSDRSELFFYDDKISVTNVISGVDYNLNSTAVFRDTGAWYHVVLSTDTTQSTAANRVKIYINNANLDISGSYPTQNANLAVNNTVVHYIGENGGFGRYFDGYMAEVNFIDGTALTPSSFGTTDAYGIWQPIPYTGSYGTNGFYLPFTDNSALTTSSNVGLGKDFSGNGNYWVTNNISITAGSTYDSMKDVPTNTNSNTANYCVLNPLTTKIDLLGVATLSNGNLQATSGGSNAMLCIGSIFITSGKWYAECTITTSFVDYVGIGSQTNANSTASGTGAYSYTSGGTKISNGSSSAYGATYTTGDVIGVAYDADAGTLTFYKNGTSQGTAYSGIDVSVPRTFASFNGGTGTYVHNWNFGQRPFSYTPPTGFKTLCTTNLSTPTIGATASSQANKYFDATLYTGTGSSQSITNSGSMQPDLVWAKNRGAANYNALTDSVRGVQNQIYSNTTDAELTGSNGLTAFNTNGFTVGTNANWNNNTYAFVGWQWRASNATAVTNTAGSITSTVSANTTSGFSIVTYTGNGTQPSTVGHGLGVAPKMIFVKSRSNGGTYYDWAVYNSDIGAGNAMLLNSTSGSFSKPSYWNSTTATSTVFTLGSDITVNQSSATYVAYCFAQIAGYSAFGSYTGNGSSDGVFIYTGFRPKYVLVKRTSNTEAWTVRDAARNPTNVATLELQLNSSAAEGAAGGLDLLSNGFKCRAANNEINANGDTYIYMAFAESPFKYALAR